MKYILECSDGFRTNTFRLQEDYTLRDLGQNYIGLETFSVVLPSDKYYPSLGAVKKDYTLCKELFLKMGINSSKKKSRVESRISLEPKVWRLTKPPIPKIEQLERVIARGDDNKNNYLVLGVDGIFRLIPYEEFFPGKCSIAVKNEPFGAGNDYVGERAANDKDYIKETYIQSLDGWLKHLLSGKLEIVDYGSLTESEIYTQLKRLKWPVQINDRTYSQFRIGKSV